jgi:hypothetical protein
LLIRTEGRVIMGAARETERYREDSLRELRYLVAGVDALRSSTATIAVHVGAHLSEVAVNLSALVDQMWQTNALLGAQVRIQQEMLDVLRSPSRTAATELLLRAGSAAERQLWPEAIRDYDRSIEQNWDQPEAHLGRGLALVGAAGVDGRTSQVLTDAAESFERAFRYGEHVRPQTAVRAVQLAVAMRDRLGQIDRAEQLLRSAVERLGASPELAFSAGLRFRSVHLLDRAVTLAPALAGDPTWLQLPVAEPLVERLASAQNAAIEQGVAALRAAAKHGTGAVPSVVRTDPTSRFAALQEIDKRLEAASQVLSRPSADEQAHRSRGQALKQQTVDGSVATTSRPPPAGRWRTRCRRGWPGLRVGESGDGGEGWLPAQMPVVNG